MSQFIRPILRNKHLIVKKRYIQKPRQIDYRDEGIKTKNYEKTSKLTPAQITCCDLFNDFAIPVAISSLIIATWVAQF